MKTFVGEYRNGNYVLSGDDEVLRAQLISILNTEKGTRFYYPSYGSNLRDFRFSVLNYFTINMIGQEVKSAIDLLNGVKLSSIDYQIDGNSIKFNISLTRMSTRLNINISVADGVAS